MPIMSAMEYLGLGPETTRGTGVTPAAYIPIEAPTFQPNPVFLEDKGMRGSPTTLYSEQVGVRHDTMDLKGFVFLDTFPHILRAALGSTDTITGAGPYVHTIGQYFSVPNGSQPPSYTLADFSAGSAGSTSARQFTASQLSEVMLKFDVKGALGFESKWFANPFTSISAPTSSFSTEIFVPAYNCAVSWGGSTSSVVESAEIKIDRKVEPLFTLGSQSPYRLWASPLEVTGKFTAIYEITGSDPLKGATVITDATTRVTQALVMTFTEPVSSHSCALTMSQVQLKMPKVDLSKTAVRIEGEFTAEADTTDAVGGGYAPIKSATTNAQSTTY